MSSRKAPNFKHKVKYAAVVDGGCEFWYLKMLLRNTGPDTSFNIEPKIPQKKSIKEQFELVKNLMQQGYDKVFWIIDCDTIIAETRKAKKAAPTPQQELELYIKELRKDYKDKVVVIRNNPCFEYWLLLHFEETTAGFGNCDEAGRRLKKHIKDYEKSEKYYTKQDKDIFLQLNPKLQAAIQRADKIEKQAKNNFEATVSQMHKLFLELGIKGEQ